MGTSPKHSFMEMESGGSSVGRLQRICRREIYYIEAFSVLLSYYLRCYLSTTYFHGTLTKIGIGTTINFLKRRAAEGLTWSPMRCTHA